MKKKKKKKKKKKHRRFNTYTNEEKKKIRRKNKNKSRHNTYIHVTFYSKRATAGKSEPPIDAIFLRVRLCDAISIWRFICILGQQYFSQHSLRYAHGSRTQQIPIRKATGVPTTRCTGMRPQEKRF